MLVLTRRAGESIVIGEDIVITVLEAGGTVQIGIQAPRSVPVWRKELYDEIAGQNRRAAEVQIADWCDVVGEWLEGTGKHLSG